VRNFYNDHEPFAVRWLENLIAKGLIPRGHVDNRPIDDLEPSDLKEYAQCHFFAGIAGWPHALRLAGWHSECWTGSCPCQPFSTSGMRRGFADERHLWPTWFRLIRECRPPVLFGEQVAPAVAHGWLDLVFDDLEDEGYSCRAAVFPACSVGAPHIRQRIYWVADARGARPGIGEGDADAQRPSEDQDHGMADADFQHGEHDRGRGGGAGAETQDRPRRHAEFLPGGGSSLDGLGNADDFGQGERRRDEPEGPAGEPGEVGGLGNAHGEGSRGRGGELGHQPGEGQAGADVPSFWDDCEWIECRDGKSRPIRPGVAVLSNGVPARVAKLRALGNAIVPQAAAVFIQVILGAAETNEAFLGLRKDGFPYE
jgi:DNA (cytosine-5)-methyltransferase 1